MSPIRVLVAGSTQHTLQCAMALYQNPNFLLVGVLTPAPKPVGRKQEVIPNPLHAFAAAKHLPVTLVERKIAVQTTLPDCDILLVVDFGFIIPAWLLSHPSIAPLNIHPSDLPKYRGSSPGQFALMAGETHSAVSVIKMDEKMDHGPIIAKLPFEIGADWTASDYYSHAFALVSQNLAQIILDFIASPNPQPQPDESPTPIARKLKREDGFIEDSKISNFKFQISNIDTELYNKWRGMTPWPGIWTMAEKDGTLTRLKILKMSNQNNQIKIDTIQWDGGRPQKY